MFLLKCTLKVTSKKPSPIRIPLTGANIKGQDYFSVNLTRVGHSYPDLLVRKSGKRGVACKEWVQGENDGRFSKNLIIPWEELRNARMEVRHYLKGNEFRYKSIGTFLWKELVFLPQLSVFKNWVSQALYNNRTPVRSSRIELLKRLVDRRIRYHADSNNYLIRNESGDSILALLKDIYGDRIYAHPKNDGYRANLLIDLDSLVATEDVRIINHNYVASGKAVVTIAAYEEENRRHIDNKKHNSRIFWLTIALVLIGLLQVPYIQRLLGIGVVP